MFQIACNEGFDGGLSQEFIVELFEVGQKAPMSSMIAKYVVKLFHQIESYLQI